MQAFVYKALALTALSGALVFGSVDGAAAHYRHHHHYYGYRHHHHHYGYGGYYYRPHYYRRYPGCVPLLGIVSGDFCN